jgi:hypothetical protein
MTSPVPNRVQGKHQIRNKLPMADLATHEI